MLEWDLQKNLRIVTDLKELLKKCHLKTKVNVQMSKCVNETQENSLRLYYSERTDLNGNQKGIWTAWTHLRPDAERAQEKIFTKWMGLPQCYIMCPVLYLHIPRGASSCWMPITKDILHFWALYVWTAQRGLFLSHRMPKVYPWCPDVLPPLTASPQVSASPNLQVSGMMWALSTWNREYSKIEERDLPGLPHM